MGQRKNTPTSIRKSRHPIGDSEDHRNSVASSTITWPLALVIFVMVGIAFAPAFQNQFVDWDDTDNFLRNTSFRGLGWENIQWMFSTFHMGHYQPLTWLTLGFDYVWGGMMYGEHPEYGYGMDPRSFHLTNIVLHAANAVLVFFIGIHLIGRGTTPHRSRSAGVIAGAVVAALAFGIHPLRVESVAWATERRDLLSGFFLLLATIAYLRASALTSTHRRRWMLLTIGLFTMSLLSKVIGVTLPAVLLILDCYPLRRLPASPRRWLDRQYRSVFLEKVPFLLLAIVFAAIASIGQGRNNWLVTLDMHGPLARIVQSLYGLAFYAWKTIVPNNLLPLYQLQMPMNIGEARFAIAGIVVIAAAVAVFFLRHRQPALVTASLVYALMLAPVLGLMQNGPQIVADRYSYLPCIAWAILAGGGLMLIWHMQRRMITLSATALALIAVSTLGILTWRQSQVWRDTASLWTYLYQHDPSSGFAQNGYGYVLLQQSRFAESASVLRHAVQTYPQNEKAHYNLWTALRKQGDTQGLIAAYESAMQIPTIEDYARFEYGNFLIELQDNEKAAALFVEVLNRNPNHTNARTNLGFALVRMKRREEAIKHYQIAIETDPNHFQARYNLALALRTTGDSAGAIQHLRIATQLRPDHAGAQNALQQLLNDRQ